MRILFVTPYVPSPIRVRPYNFIRLLARHHEVVVLTLWHNAREWDDLALLRNLVPVVGVGLTRAEAIARCGRALLGAVPLQAAYDASPTLPALARAALDPEAGTAGILPRELRGRFDVVHVEHLRAAGVARQLPDDVPTVYDSVDCISLLLERTIRSSHSLRQRALALLEARRTRAYEGQILGWFDRVAVTSGDDARALESLRSDASVAVIPNGVDLDYFQPLDAPREPSTLVLSGKMSYHANVTAALHFVNRILPLVRASHPDARLRVVGSNPLRSIQRLAGDPRISVTGYLSDIRPALGTAGIAICPVTVKVGIQNKILEAMAMGLPVVTTREGATGLDAEPGRDYFVASDPFEFANHVSRLLDDVLLRERLGRAGRAYVERHHRWATAAGNLEQLYHEAIDRHSERRAAPNESVLRAPPTS